MNVADMSCTVPTVGPQSINATALSAFEIQLWWDPVQQLSANGILRGYEVCAIRQAVSGLLTGWGRFK